MKILKKKAYPIVVQTQNQILSYGCLFQKYSYKIPAQLWSGVFRIFVHGTLNTTPPPEKQNKKKKKQKQKQTNKNQSANNTNLFYFIILL